MLLGSNNAGTQFFMTFHPCYMDQGTGAGIRIYISSLKTTTVTVEIPAIGFNKQYTTIANGIIEIPLKPEEALCYVKPTNMDYCQPQQVFKGRAIIINAEDPIICYGVVRYPYTSDGFLAMPVEDYGKNYVVSSYNAWGWSMNDHGLSSYTSIVGVHDDTEVEFTLGGESHNFTPGTDGLKTGDKRTKVLNKGDVWLIGVEPAFADLSGSIVKADKPVSVISGVYCANVPRMIYTCDYLIEQDLPMDSWGHKYHVPVFKNRKKAPVIRVYAGEPNLQLKRGGVSWSTIKTVGGEQGIGYIEKRTSSTEELKDAAPKPVVLSSDKPFTVALFNPGIQDDGVDSDPFQLQLLPLELYQNNMMFNTPGVNNGKSFKNNYLSLTYRAEINGDIPDDFELGHVENGTVAWKKVKNLTYSDHMKYEDSDIPPTERQWYHLTYKLDDPAGVYLLKAKEPFAAYGYGDDWCDSYGYPVAGAFFDVKKGDTLPPMVKIDTYDEAKGVYKIKIADEPQNNPQKRTNLRRIDFIDSESYNFEFNIPDFVIGETSQLDVELTVVNKIKSAKGVIRAQDRAGKDTFFSVDHKSLIATSVQELIFDNITSEYKNQTANFEITNTSDQSITIESLLFENKNSENLYSIKSIKLNGAVVTLPINQLKANEKITVEVSLNAEKLKQRYIKKGTAFNDELHLKVSDILGNINESEILVVKTNFLIEMKPSLHSTVDAEKTYAGSSSIINLELKNVSTFELEVAKIEILSENGSNIFSLVDSPSLPLIMEADDKLNLQIKFSPDKKGFFNCFVIITFANLEETYKIKVDAEGETPVDIAETNQLNKMVVIPNPLVGNKIQIETNLITTGNYSVNIYSLEGKLVYSENIGNLSNGEFKREFVIPNLPKGVYNVEINSGNQKYNTNLIID